MKSETSKYGHLQLEPELLQTLALELATDDALELTCMHYESNLAGIEASIERSWETRLWGLADEQKPLCIYGLADFLLAPRIVMPWMLAHQDLPLHARPFLRGSRQWINHVAKDHDMLAALVGTWHTRSIRWLEWLGFDIGQPITVEGYEGVWHPVSLSRRMQ